MPLSKKQQKILNDLGKKVQEIRLSKGLTLKEVGYRIEKDPQSISRVEMGDVNPTFLYLTELCVGLEISLSELVD